MANDTDTQTARPASSPASPTSGDKVNSRDPASLDKWAKALGVTGEALESAIKAVGPDVEKIKTYLTGGQAGSQSDG